MKPEPIIRKYVADVTARLPHRMRHDIALELTSLLQEELNARTDAEDRPADDSLALEIVNNFGHPEKVAAEYHTPWTIIAPADTRAFCLTAVVGGALVAAAQVPTTLLRPEDAREPSEYLVWWLGVLVLLFAARSLISRRRDEDRDWKPAQLNRGATLALAALSFVGILVYGAPAWLYGQLTGGQELTSWLQYDPDFHRARLPWLLALWAAQGLLLLEVGRRGEWTETLRRVNYGLSAGVIVVLGWFLSAERLFVEAVPNATALAFVRAFLFALLIDLGLRLYLDRGRVRDLPTGTEAAA